MKTTKTGIAALAAAMAVAFSLSACGNGGGTSKADNEINAAANAIKQEMGEKDFNEAANAIKEELSKETTTAAAETAPAEDEIVTPDANEFETTFDEALGGLVINRYKGAAKRIHVPAEIGGEPVKCLGCEGKYSPKGFSRGAVYVEINEGIVEIGDFAFINDNGIKDVIIPSGVTRIGKQTFYYCTNIDSLVIPDTVTKIDASAFTGCKSITVTYKGEKYNYSNMDDLYALCK